MTPVSTGLNSHMLSECRVTAQRLEGDHGGLWHGLRPQTGSPAKNREVHMDKREHTLSAGL